MKKVIYTIAILASIFIYNTINAQQRACIWCGYNIDSQPVWGPVGYSNADYYYMPDIEVYYFVSEQQFIFREKGVWKTNSSLPARFLTFNLFKAHKVVINEEKPYLLHETNKVQYLAFKGQHDQQAIRDSHDLKYTETKSAPERNRIAAALAKATSQNQRREARDQHKDADQQKIVAQR